MKRLKHILVVIALLMVAIPCSHAESHAEHAHDTERQAEICATHACACHTCGDIPCADELEMPQQIPVVSTSAAIPTISVMLFTVTEIKSEPRQLLVSAQGTLASLQTVQLLI